MRPGLAPDARQSATNRPLRFIEKGFQNFSGQPSLFGILTDLAHNLFERPFPDHTENMVLAIQLCNSEQMELRVSDPSYERAEIFELGIKRLG